MGVGSGIGTRIDEDWQGNLFQQRIGAVLMECSDNCVLGEKIGDTIPEWVLSYEGDWIDLAPMQEIWERKLEKVFPWHGHEGETTETFTTRVETRPAPALHVAKPRVFIPVFPGTNCEYDTARAVERAGGLPQVMVINNLSPEAIAESIRAAAAAISGSQAIVLPGGFSGGDEPDGSAKFITAFFRNAAVKEQVEDLMDRRGGLMLGICNGFQALIKLGLVPFGEIRDTDADCPTLTFNNINRHQSRYVTTRVASLNSPWLAGFRLGEEHVIAISHGEGKFVAPDAVMKQLVENGQIAFQYVDAAGVPSMDVSANPNGSYNAVEGILSPDGRVLGKMGHTERRGPFVAKNIVGNKFQPLFENGVRYFTGNR
jgi:phosphoribosylformylglycinamidine synthase